MRNLKAERMGIKITMDLTHKAHELRALIFKTIIAAGGGHIPTSFSIVEILTVLFYKVLNFNLENHNDPDRDRFILSKGHGAVSLYAVLADLGFFDTDMLMSFGKKGTRLGGHPDMYKVPGVEASTGSLGHGFPFAIGQALAGKIDKKDYRVYALLGDGECQEGSVWEAALCASHNELDNFIAIVDYNKFQAMDRIESINALEPFVDKWKAFGWETVEVDGHDIGELLETLKSVPLKKGKPNLIMAHTLKGKGISYMENQAIWHYRMPNEEEMKIACQELGLKESL